MTHSNEALLEMAKQAMLKTYSPYSNFPVGACVVTASGETFTGCNVENASYGGTICAERTALVKAISEGHTKFKSIAVVCEKAKDAWPCGLCRQFICEFGANIEIIVEDSSGKVKTKLISQLLPEMFGPAALGK